MDPFGVLSRPGVRHVAVGSVGVTSQADSRRPARSERHALADLLTELGPDAPTMCTGWTTRDLAAHLVTRERRPDAAVGIMIRPLSGWTDRVRGRHAARRYADLVDDVRNPPWWSMSAVPAIDAAVNTAEFFIHHEDVRRARPDWAPRDLRPELDAVLWRQVARLARLGLRRVRADLVLAAPGHGEVRAGAGGPEVRLTGPPGELAIFISGRQHAALVDLAGPAELTERLRHTRLGI